MTSQYEKYIQTNTNPEHLDEFWRFVYERQMVWHNRFVLKLPREQWTQDEILKKYKFTNVYRKLDRGSIWLIENVINKASRKNDRQNMILFWRIFCYRMINRIETFEKVGIPSYIKWDPTTFREALEKLFKQGPVFTSAYITCQSSKKQSRIMNAIDMFNDMHNKIEVVWEIIKNARSLKEVHHTLEGVYGIGHFTAYQIALDMIYAELIPFSRDDWADIGPGCKSGLEIIFPGEHSKPQFYRFMVWLRDSQEVAFKQRKLKFPYPDGETILLSDIENCLCEFAKYHKCKRGEGRVRIIFQPNTQ